MKKEAVILKPKVLIIEDNEALLDNLKGFTTDFADVTTALDGLTGELYAKQDAYDAIVLDLMLPEINGFDLLKNLRASKIETPVLILTAKDTLQDKLHGFDLGADDYLTKPFHREEFIARLKALLQRNHAYHDDQKLAAGPIEIDLATHTITVNGQAVNFPGKEFDLLSYLIENQNTILTKEQIFNHLWGFDSQTNLNVIEVYISNVRKSLKQVMDHDVIKTVRNVGYMLEV
ncbi:two-component response regulator [Lactobacillus selangorensis]|uniref:Two-component response regulator n=1 Tax=Lactobacillus selangorensis TaxID=81857 RepID=A0A0R2FPX4_9LACO|nr:response regulator transcription factor [Lactobacillus selangorensis]KRN27944.1 two-component response regulator [Lactobacillus selangorensis]KRN30585.1 two-component response regulator [Lactobacillus selangorensis]